MCILNETKIFKMGKLCICFSYPSCALNRLTFASFLLYLKNNLFNDTAFTLNVFFLISLKIRVFKFQILEIETSQLF